MRAYDKLHIWAQRFRCEMPRGGKPKLGERKLTLALEWERRECITDAATRKNLKFFYVPGHALSAGPCSMLWCCQHHRLCSKWLSINNIAAAINIRLCSSPIMRMETGHDLDLFTSRMMFGNELRECTYRPLIPMQQACVSSVDTAVDRCNFLFHGFFF